METIELKAYTRNEFRKGSARRLRKQGLIPAVFYGATVKSIPLTVNSSELVKLLGTVKGESKFIKLTIEDDGDKVEKLSIIKDLQVNPISRNPLHADFYEIRMDHKIIMDIPIRLTGQSVGIEEGGDLQFSKRNLKVSALPSSIPDLIEVDISNLNIGDSVKVEDVVLGEDIEILDPPDVMIVAVVAERVAVLEVEEEEAEGELPEKGGEDSESEEGQSKETSE
ncbi:MAG: 50S ribosomal protein L25/general stress protein Ctc [Syntrophales bacterium]|nr:50S ribosomal protein L25/general stress protein Ctc [Syntrophales bacterium]